MPRIIEMSAALFEQLDEVTFQPTEHSRGPWDRSLLHGGPVAALLAHQLCARSVDGDWFPARLTVDLMRPLGLSPLEVTTSALRVGRKAQLLSADCRTGDTLVARAGLQMIAATEAQIPRGSPARSWAATGNTSSPEASPQAWPKTVEAGTAFHSTSVEHRSRDDVLSGNGPAADWIRVLADLLPDVPLSPFERVVSAADFSNGISSSLPFENFTYVNADLSVNLFRLPVDEWVQVDATTYADDQGVGLAAARLLDRSGLIGHAYQSLVIARR